MISVEKQGNGLLWQRGGEMLLITPWGRDSARVRGCMQKDPADDRWALLDPEDVNAVITIGENEATLKNGKLTVRLTECGWGGAARLHFENEKGETLIEETDVGGALALSPRQYKLSQRGEYAITYTLQSDENEHLYGMGQYQQEILDIKGCSFNLFHRNTQASVPFVVSSKGYGFLWHCPSVGEAHFAKNRTTWEAASAAQLDYWITAGDSAQEILTAYGRATGFAPMMPEYGLGFWQCKLRYWNQEQLLSVAREYKRRGLKIDVIVMDFFHWPHLGDYRVDEEFWPDLKGMCKELDEMGIKLMVSIWPQIGLTGESYDEMNRQGLLMRSEAGVGINYTWTEYSVFYDPTNPKARKYVWDKCKKNYLDNGVSLFWLDEAEPELAGYDYEAYRYWAGTGLAVTNLYPQQYAKTFYDGMVESGVENPVSLLRCAWAGSQRYGALVWSGDIHSDWETFRKQVCAGLNMGMAGIPWWTTDIGGFSGANTYDEAFHELLVRWFQWGAFCPVMRLHGDRDPHTNLFKKDGTPALFTGAENEIWSFGEENIPTLECYMKLREAMRDYTRETMAQAHESLAPVMRPMFFEFPDEEVCYTLKDQYMFGSDVLVAPVMEKGATSRPVLLPKGAKWTDLNTGKVYEGGQAIDAPAPLCRMPVFLRDGRHAEWCEVMR